MHAAFTDCLDNTWRIRPSLRTRFVSELASTKIDGSTRPHTVMIPKGAGSSMNLVISKPVRSSMENKAPSTYRCGKIGGMSMLGRSQEDTSQPGPGLMFSFNRVYELHLCCNMLKALRECISLS